MRPAELWKAHLALHVGLNVFVCLTAGGDKIELAADREFGFFLAMQGTVELTELCHRHQSEKELSQ